MRDGRQKQKRHDDDALHDRDRAGGERAIALGRMIAVGGEIDEIVEDIDA